eukprot:Pgem_evm1s226
MVLLTITAAVCLLLGLASSSTNATVKGKDVPLSYDCLFSHSCSKSCYQLKNYKWAYYNHYSKTGGSHGFGKNVDEQIYFANRTMCELNLLGNFEKTNKWKYSLYESGKAEKIAVENEAKVVCVNTKFSNYIIMIYDIRDESYNYYSSIPGRKYDTFQSVELCKSALINVRYGEWNEVPNNLAGYRELFTIASGSTFIGGRGMGSMRERIREGEAISPSYSLLRQAIYESLPKEYEQNP